MTLFQAVVLGVLQGLTEFLPVSSSGHLVMVQFLFNYTEPPIFFDVLLHVATLLAVIVYFRKRLLKLSFKQAKLALAGTVPAVIAGLFLKSYLEPLFNSLILVSIGLLYTGFILLVTYFLKKQSLNINQLSIKNSLIIGSFQAIAIVPGISRSGSTVFASLFQGLRKKDAFYFSFLLSIPAIIGAMVLQLKDPINTSNISYLNFTAGFFTSAVSGLVALKLLEIVINKAKLHYFAFYCLTLGLIIFVSQFR